MPSVQETFDAEYAPEFEKLGIWYEHRLIDDVSPCSLVLVHVP